MPRSEDIDALMHLRGDLYATALAPWGLLPAATARSQPQRIDSELLVLSGDIFGTAVSEPPADRPAAPPEAPQPEPSRSAPPTPRRRSSWNKTSVLAGFVIGVSVGGLALAGLQGISLAGHRTDARAVAVGPLCKAAAARVVDVVPRAKPASSAPRAEPAPVAKPGVPAQGARTAVPARAPAPARPTSAAPEQVPVERAGSVAPGGAGIDRAAAAVAVAVAAGRASACVGAGELRTTMPVRVTFAPSGQVTTATVTGGPFAGTEVGSCVARALRTARVGPFDGPAVSVRRSVQIR